MLSVLPTFFPSVAHFRLRTLAPVLAAQQPSFLLLNQSSRCDPALGALGDQLYKKPSGKHCRPSIASEWDSKWRGVHHWGETEGVTSSPRTYVAFSMLSVLPTFFPSVAHFRLRTLAPVLAAQQPSFLLLNQSSRCDPALGALGDQLYKKPSGKHCRPSIASEWDSKWRGVHHWSSHRSLVRLSRPLADLLQSRLLSFLEANTQSSLLLGGPRGDVLHSRCGMWQ